MSINTPLLIENQAMGGKTLYDAFDTEFSRPFHEHVINRFQDVNRTFDYKTHPRSSAKRVKLEYKDVPEVSVLTDRGNINARLRNTDYSTILGLRRALLEVTRAQYPRPHPNIHLRPNLLKLRFRPMKPDHALDLLVENPHNLVWFQGEDMWMSAEQIVEKFDPLNLNRSDRPPGGHHTDYTRWDIEQSMRYAVTCLTVLTTARTLDTSTFKVMEPMNGHEVIVGRKFTYIMPKTGGITLILTDHFRYALQSKQMRVNSALYSDNRYDDHGKTENLLKALENAARCLVNDPANNGSFAKMYESVTAGIADSNRTFSHFPSYINDSSLSPGHTVTLEHEPDEHSQDDHLEPEPLVVVAKRDIDLSVVKYILIMTLAGFDVHTLRDGVLIYPSVTPEMMAYSSYLLVKEYGLDTLKRCHLEGNAVLKTHSNQLSEDPHLISLKAQSIINDPDRSTRFEHGNVTWTSQSAYAPTAEAILSEFERVAEADEIPEYSSKLESLPFGHYYNVSDFSTGLFCKSAILGFSHDESQGAKTKLLFESLLLTYGESQLSTFIEQINTPPPSYILPTSGPIYRQVSHDAWSVALVALLQARRGDNDFMEVLASPHHSYTTEVILPKQRWSFLMTALSENKQPSALYVMIDKMINGDHLSKKTEPELMQLIYPLGVGMSSTDINFLADLHSLAKIMGGLYTSEYLGVLGVIYDTPPKPVEVPNITATLRMLLAERRRNLPGCTLRARDALTGELVSDDDLSIYVKNDTLALLKLEISIEDIKQASLHNLFEDKAITDLDHLKASYSGSTKMGTKPNLLSYLLRFPTDNANDVTQVSARLVLRQLAKNPHETLFGSITSPKEFEQKLAARCFTTLTLNARLICALSEWMLVKYILPAFSEQSLTVDREQLSRMMSDMSLQQVGQSTTYLGADFISWCRSWCKENTEHLTACLDELLSDVSDVGLQGLAMAIFGSLLLSAQKSVLWPDNPYDLDNIPTGDKIISRDGLSCKNYGSGTEGIKQKLWTLISIVMIKDFCKKYPEYSLNKLLVCGDNLILRVSMTGADVHCPSDFKATFFTRFAEYHESQGFFMKPNETFMSPTISIFLKNMLTPVDVVECVNRTAGKTSIFQFDIRENPITHSHSILMNIREAYGLSIHVKTPLLWMSESLMIYFLIRQETLENLRKNNIPYLPDSCPQHKLMDMIGFIIRGGPVILGQSSFTYVSLLQRGTISPLACSIKSWRDAAASGDLVSQKILDMVLKVRDLLGHRGLNTPDVHQYVQQSGTMGNWAASNLGPRVVTFLLNHLEEQGLIDNPIFSLPTDTDQDKALLRVILSEDKINSPLSRLMLDALPSRVKLSLRSKLATLSSIITLVKILVKDTSPDLPPELYDILERETDFFLLHSEELNQHRPKLSVSLIENVNRYDLVLETNRVIMMVLLVLDTATATQETSSWTCNACVAHQAICLAHGVDPEKAEATEHGDAYPLLLTTSDKSGVKMATVTFKWEEMWDKATGICILDQRRFSSSTQASMTMPGAVITSMPGADLPPVEKKVRKAINAAWLHLSSGRANLVLAIYCQAYGYDMILRVTQDVVTLNMDFARYMVPVERVTKVSPMLCTRARSVVICVSHIDSAPGGPYGPSGWNLCLSLGYRLHMLSPGGQRVFYMRPAHVLPQLPRVAEPPVLEIITWGSPINRLRWFIGQNDASVSLPIDDFITSLVKTPRDEILIPSLLTFGMLQLTGIMTGQDAKVNHRALANTVLSVGDVAATVFMYLDTLWFLASLQVPQNTALLKITGHFHSQINTITKFLSGKLVTTYNGLPFQLRGANLPATLLRVSNIWVNHRCINGYQPASVPALVSRGVYLGNTIMSQAMEYDGPNLDPFSGCSLPAMLTFGEDVIQYQARPKHSVTPLWPGMKLSGLTDDDRPKDTGLRHHKLTETLDQIGLDRCDEGCAESQTKILLLNPTHLMLTHVMHHIQQVPEVMFSKDRDSQRVSFMTTCHNKNIMLFEDGAKVTCLDRVIRTGRFRTDSVLLCERCPGHNLTRQVIVINHAQTGPLHHLCTTIEKYVHKHHTRVDLALLLTNEQVQENHVELAGLQFTTQDFTITRVFHGG